MTNKIHPELLNTVRTLSASLVPCFLYANNYTQLLDELNKLNIIYQEFPFINCFYANLTNRQIITLSKLSSINFITKSCKVSTMLDKVKKFINLNTCSTDTLSSNITIAFIDTGISPHLDFLLPTNRILHFKDLINNHTYPYDDNGHGTFVCGVCASSGVCSNGKYSGITKNANIVMIKALDKNGETTSNKILEAMQYIYSIRKKYNIKIVCMSFGADYSGRNDPLQQGALTLWNSGIVVVAAAGNSGPDKHTIKSPGTSSRIITVGGLDDGRNDGQIKIADFSSRGPCENKFKPDLVAPSVEITSTSNISNHQLYTQMSGTSVATPIVAGICALILKANPTFTPDKLKYTLLNNCTPITFNKNNEGYGYFKFE